MLINTMKWAENLTRKQVCDAQDMNTRCKPEMVLLPILPISQYMISYPQLSTKSVLFSTQDINLAPISRITETTSIFVLGESYTGL